MTSNTDGDPRLEDLLLRWEELRDQGRSVTPQELCSTCPELAEELARRIAMLRQFDPLEDGTTTCTEKDRPAAVGPAARETATARAEFRDLRFHAAGALGEVFMARNAELNREVALKFLKPERTRDADSRRRFLQEAEVTGRLEHPGVVPIYALGTDAAGSPCYAMRFVRGETLQDAIDAYHAAETPGRDPTERSMALRDLLDRLVSICGTIGYAHSRGILHRDLKPRNVMLGKYDETLVVDWGLAKPFDRDDASREIGEETLTPGSGSGSGGSETPTVGVVGTPAYMSPEQAEARWDLVGPASDIFALGGILYAILTGRAPHQGKRIGEILENVKRCEFPPPRQIRPVAPRALEAICLKAMARRPEDRYGSASDLATDLRRWLADEPVSAYPEPLVARARRWTRRHRVAVTTAGVAALVGLAALAIAYWRESEFNRKLLDSYQELERANLRVSKAREESDRRLEQTFQAVEDYYTGVGQEVLLGQEGFRDLRARLLERPREFYERLAREIESIPAADDRSRSLLARGRGNLGRILQMLGRLDEARTQFEAGIALLDRLAKDRPARPEYRAQLAAIRVNLGVLQMATGEHRGAMQNGRQAIAMLTELAGVGPDAARNEAQLASAYSNLGLEQEQTGDRKGAIESQGRAIAAYRRLSAAHPDSAIYRDGLAMGLNNLGLVRRSIGDNTAAMESYREAIATWDRLATERPEVTDYRHRSATSYNNLGQVQRTLGDRRGAIDSFSKAVAIWDQLSAAQPNVPLYRSRLAAGYGGLGVARAMTGDSRGALESLRQAEASYTRLAESRDSIPEYESGLAKTLNNLGMVLASTGDLPGAQSSYRQAIRIWVKLAAAHPSVPDYQMELVLSYTNLGVAQESAGDHRGSIETCLLANTAAARLVSAHPEVLEYRDQLARSHNNVGASQDRAGDRRGAMESYRRAIAIQADLVRDRPKVPAYRESLALSHTNLGLARNADGDIPGAIETHREAVAIASRLVESFPDSPDARSLLGLVLHNLAESLHDARRFRDAEQAYRQAADSQRMAYDRAPRVAKFRSYLNGHHKGLSRSLRSLGEADGAARIARARLGLVGGDPLELYAGVCDLALCIPIVQDGARKQALAVEAVQVLHRAVAAGWRDAARTGRDPDLAPLRGRDDFRRVLDDLFDRCFPADPFAS